MQALAVPVDPEGVSKWRWVVGGGGGIRVPHVLHLDGLVFPVPGLYAFDVRVDGEHHASLPLTVYGPESSAIA